MTLTKSIGVVPALVMAACLPSCHLVTYPEVELSGLSLCRWEDGEIAPTPIPRDVPTDEMRICVCGNIEDVEESYLRRSYVYVDWYYGTTHLESQAGVFSTGEIFACIENEEGFDSGTYRVGLSFGKHPLGTMVFWVGEAD